ncbi:uncharacterized protein SEPMUDRAFT_150898 [Sphaerulina musiva SO2202]|uniref:Uncharacterized protein n=1 Tax=Sphaerulina musiva (strain SO2202) TaxID=692275 RepID=N1QEQ2_SPHMS|nr:uncharacterized protein SEPMUDRAFT_150898 [Sphaerulina musiva SO2202]EMF10971.1 hypothetical protein SEPMUDRAFT_150898 [Sphaerulina musiva SO2202]
MSNPVHSTGRGGAGNIGHDTNNYVDGAIVREGAVGESGVPEYSAGRGGAGNMVQPTGSQLNKPSEEIVPESATRIGGADYDNFHTGRGGQGNIHKEKYGGHSSAKEQDAAIAKNSPKNSPHVGAQKESILEKVKHAVGLDKKEKTPEPTTL